MTEHRYHPQIQKLIAVLMAFFAVLGIQLLYEIRTDSTMFSNSVFHVVVFGAFLFLCLCFWKKNPDRRTCLFGLCGGLLFAAMTSMGFSLNYSDTIWNKNVLPATLCLTPFFGVCTGFLLLQAEHGVEKGHSIQGEEEEHGLSKLFNGIERTPGRRWYFFCWLILFLSWVPVLLASWPGIFSYDCGWQLVSFADGKVTGHHPILHTFLLGICMRAGQGIFGSNQVGALLYSLLQMVLMSGMYAYVCLFLKKRQAPWLLQAGTFLFLAFHPVNSLMALCATKDSIFSALFAVFLIQIFELLEDRKGFFLSLRRQTYFCLSVFFLFAFRNNGFHTFLLCIPFFLWVFRKYWKRMGILILICVSLWLLYTGPLYHAFGIEQSDPREMCSVLMQSAARAYNLDYQGLTEEEKEAFLSIIEEEGMQSYLSRFADPVKAFFNGEKFADNPGPFLKAWFSVGMKHKKIYIDAFLANTFGYWYPGNSIEDTERGRDYFEYYCKEFREDVDVVMTPRLPALSEFYRGIGNEASFQKVPVVAATFNLGSYTWLLIFAFLLLLYRRQYGEMILVIPLAMYFATTLLGPVVKMRYHYPLIVCAPLILYIIFKEDPFRSGKAGE